MIRATFLVVMLLVAMATAGCQGGASPQQIIGAVQQVTQSGGDIRGAFVDMDEPEEVELGRSVTAGVGARYSVSRDVALTKYVALVGNTVAAQSDRPDLHYYFAVLDSPDINALAAPGGFVFITRGALDLMNDEAALAGVLGHEVGHIALKHHGETIKAQKRKVLFVRGAQIGASFTQAAPFTNLIGLTADAIIENIILKGHSRGEEMESDQVGFRYAARAGYDPAGLRDFLAVLKAKSSDAGVAKFFSTHPGIDERLQEQAKLRQDYKEGGKREPQRFAQAMGRVQVQPPPPAPPPAQVQPPAQQPQPQPATPQRRLQPRQPQRQPSR
jgi:beta-barrel assembly-enhancing protease